MFKEESYIEYELKKAKERIAELEKQIEDMRGYRGSVHVDDMGRYDPYTDSFVRGE